MSEFFAEGLLANEVAVITGGSSGIGLAIASAFAGLGCDVALVSRSAERLAAAAGSVSAATGRLCSTFVCDVRDEEGVRRVREEVVARHGTPTIVVNNAAANFPMPAERMTSRAFRTVVDIDLVGTFNVTLAFVGEMIERGGGVILNIVIPVAHLGFPGFAHAGAAKAGVTSLTRSWAREWGGHGIRVNALGLGPVPTEGVAQNMLGPDEGAGFTSNAEFFEGATARTPLRRLGAGGDVAGAAVFLCSKAGSWITGAVLTVDGGLATASR